MNIIDESKFDPTDKNEAIKAAEDAVMLAMYMLRWRAASWPKDPSTNDGGWAHKCVEVIRKYGFDHQIPDLYRAAASPIKDGGAKP